MTFAMLKIAAAGPEILVLVGTCAILMVDVFRSPREGGSTLAYWLTLLLLLAGGVLTVLGFGQNAGLALNGYFLKDSLGDLLKVFIYLATFVTFVYSREYLRERGLLKGEFFVLGLFSMLGMLVLVSAGSFLTIFLGLELLSLPLYAMVAFDRDSAVASEAAMKYFVMGAIATGMLLYGMSMLYGATGSLDLAQVSAAVHQVVAGHADQQQLVLVFGTVFVVVGVAFKLGAVPFHMWLPDVYQGSPTPVTLFLSAAPKLAAFAMLMRLLMGALEPLVGQWQQMIAVLAVLSMVVGNVVAISQTNIKRMLGYSAIAHVGFLFLGMMASEPQGYSAALFYMITYSMMSLGSLGMVLLLSRAGFEAERVEDFKGLNERSPWFAAMMAIIMLSMAGAPPFIGFWAKWEVLRAVVFAGQVWLAILAVFFSIIGAWYYLRVVWFMYFEKARDVTPLVPTVGMGAMISVNGLALLCLGVFPGSLMAVCLMVLSR